MSRLIPLSKGYEAIVDDADFDMLSKHRWSATVEYHSDGLVQQIYAIRWTRRYPNNARYHQMMHRFILGLSKGEKCDHINHDGLDNRRHNLRVCSTTQNAQNKRWSPRLKTSQFKGVSRDKFNGVWKAHIQVNGQPYDLGRFQSEVAAAQAYNVAALQAFGAFAFVNSLEAV